MIAYYLKSKRISLIDVIFVLLMAGILYYGASWQFFSTNDDATRYQCYTQVFWHGINSIGSLGSNNCHFLISPDRSIVPMTQTELVNALKKVHMPTFIVNYVNTQSRAQRFHALPYEYPMLTLIPFTLAMIFVPVSFFQVAFAILMVVLAAVVYFVLLRWRSRGTALVYAILLVAGGWGTVVGRFDLIPAALTLIAVILGDHKRWNWSFAFLALAVLFKYYPVVLLIPFLVVQLRDSEFAWKSWKRWQPLGIFVLLCVVVMGTSLLLSVQGTISPFLYLGNRPVQVESLSAVFVWLSTIVFSHTAHYVYTFGSLNIVASGASVFSTLTTLLELVGVLYVFWLLWRRKLDLAACCLLILLLIIVTGKVFSPQYLIWVIPMVAYVGASKRSWVALWFIIGICTMIIYPFLYTRVHDIVKVPALVSFLPLVTVRNFLLAGFTIYLLYRATRYTLTTGTLDDSSISVEYATPVKSSSIIEYPTPVESSSPIEGSSSVEHLNE